MMCKKKFFLEKLFLLGGAFIFFSCTSISKTVLDSVYVMVYDFENAQVQNAKILVNDVEVGSTDIYGRIILQAKNEKNKVHTISVYKEDYEKVFAKSFLKQGEVIYFKIGSSSYYTCLAEKLLDKNQNEKALKAIEKALEIRTRKDALFLKKVILNKMGD